MVFNVSSGLLTSVIIFLIIAGWVARVGTGVSADFKKNFPPIFALPYRLLDVSTIGL